VDESAIIPCLHYRDPHAAIDWLGRAFGFKVRLLVPDAQDGVAHAELTLGRRMIMLGSESDDNEYRKLMRSPLRVGFCTQSIYLVVDDPDAIYRAAIEAGAPVVLPIEDKDYGGRGFVVRDLEGHIWGFGSYDPWAGESIA
jgi:uncharacterized glyoxalase superfamily protein PhnB